MSAVNTIRAERIKAFTVRSTWWNIVLTLVLSIGLSLLICVAVVATWGDTTTEDRATVQDDALEILLSGYFFGIVVMLVLGVMVMTSEYQNAMIRTTFVAEPRRVPMFAAKSLVVAVIAAGVAALFLAGSYVGGSLILGVRDIDVSLDVPGGARSFFGIVPFFVLAALFSLALGAILRSTAAAITIVVLLYLVIPNLVLLIPKYGEEISAAFPFMAGVIFLDPSPSSVYGPWAGLGIFVAYVVALWGLAAYLLKRRDA
ncbi:MAG: ABC transporter permease [Candidatus Nanopelagicales bacterium]